MVEIKKLRLYLETTLFNYYFDADRDGGIRVMKRIPTFEDELDEIRVNIYEQIKDMAIDERVLYLKSLAAPVLKEYGLRTLNQIKADEQMKKEAVLS